MYPVQCPLTLFRVIHQPFTYILLPSTFIFQNKSLFRKTFLFPIFLNFIAFPLPNRFWTHIKVFSFVGIAFHLLLWFLWSFDYRNNNIYGSDSGFVLVHLSLLFLAEIGVHGVVTVVRVLSGFVKSENGVGFLFSFSHSLIGNFPFFSFCFLFDWKFSFFSFFASEGKDWHSHPGSRFMVS